MRNDLQDPKPELKLKNKYKKGDKIERQKLSEQSLQARNWSPVTIENCTFHKSLLDRGIFKSCLISGCNLVETSIVEGNFNGTSIESTMMVGARLTNSEFREASLVAVNLKNACLCGVKFINTELHNVSLEGVCHNEHTIWPDDIDPPPPRSCQHKIGAAPTQAQPLDPNAN
ncbi:MAG: pentapeptide repeat-containing protein [Candidatus Altimarinota bacterium]